MKDLQCWTLSRSGYDPVARPALESTLYVRLADGSKVYASYDPGQVGEDRLSAVQYLRFPVGSEVPVALGSEFPELSAEVELSEEQRDALAIDLGVAAWA